MGVSKGWATARSAPRPSRRRFQRLLRTRRAELGASSMRAAGLFRYFCQRRFVGFGEGGGDRTVRFEDRFDEAESLPARGFDAAICDETAHDIGVFVLGTDEAFELSG